MNRDSLVERVEEFTNLTGINRKFLRDLSKGMKQRVSLARSLVHDPPVLVLDEPANALDPRARIELRELLKVLADQGKAILVSSHILTELSEMCNAVVIVEQGRMLRAGQMDNVVDSEIAGAHGDHPLRRADGSLAARAASNPRWCAKRGSPARRSRPRSPAATTYAASCCDTW